MKQACTLILLFAFSQLHAQTTPDLNPAFQDSIDRAIQKLIPTYHIIGLGVAVLGDDQMLFNRYYGYSDLKQKIPVDDQIRFRVGSISKPFTAFAIMQLVEQGKIDLKAPISRYLPDLHLHIPAGFREITTADLLTHTSGLTDDINNTPYSGKAIEQQELIKLLNEEIITVPPGVKMTYSNVGYGLLGCLIERISGQSYPAYLEQHIFQPLGMQNTKVTLSNAPDPGRIKGYLYDSTAIDAAPIRDMAAGGVESSLPDMVKFTQMILHQGQGIVSKETFLEMTRDHLTELPVNTDEVFGYGLFIHQLGTDQDTLIGGGIGHAGDLHEHHALLYIYPKLNIGMVILTNSEKGAAMRNKLSQKIIGMYMKVYKGATLKGAAPAQFSAASLAVDPLATSTIAGTYGGGGGDDFVRLKKLGKNKIRFIQGKSRLTLKRRSDNFFSTKVMLLGFIPIPVKSMLFGFRMADNQVYMKILDTKHKSGSYISVKDPAIPLSPKWLERSGEYEILNDYPNSVTMKPYALRCTKNKIILDRKSPISADTDSVGFNCLSNDTAVSDGIERGSGATLKVLPNGNLYYSGFELKKKTNTAKN